MHIALVHLVSGVNIDFLVRGVCQSLAVDVVAVFVFRRMDRLVAEVFDILGLHSLTVGVQFLCSTHAQDHVAKEVEAHKERDLPVCTKNYGNCSCEQMEVKSYRVNDWPLVHALVYHVWNGEPNALELKIDFFFLVFLKEIVLLWLYPCNMRLRD